MAELRRVPTAPCQCHICKRMIHVHFEKQPSHDRGFWVYARWTGNAQSTATTVVRSSNVRKEKRRDRELGFMRLFSGEFGLFG